MDVLTVRSSHTGITLIELLFVVAITSVIATTIAPSFSNLNKRISQKAATANLVSALNLARNTAIVEQTTVTVCPIDTMVRRCTNDWNLPIRVFRDKHRTGELVDTDYAIRIVQPPKGGRWVVRSGFRNYFRFRSSGWAKEAIGNFLWCPNDNDTKYSSQVRLNMGGRPTLSVDTDGDGIIEDANGNKVTCPSI
jgi:type IV fimbrial biogenesis protein FimT